MKEAARDSRTAAPLDVLARDVRYGLRQLVRTPGVSLAAIVALALGIGATVATFSVVDAVLIRPLAYQDAGELVVLRQHSAGPVSPVNFLAWRRLATSFEEIEAAEYWRPNLSGLGDSEKITGLRVTPGMFRLLGVQPEVGRTLREDDEDAREVVISRGLWVRRFGGGPDIVGRSVLLDHETFAIVGVMPASFKFAPFWATGSELWAPLPLADRQESGGQSLRVFARLPRGASPAAASDEMTTIAAALERQNPGSIGEVSVTPLKDLVVGDVRQSILIIFAAVGLVLLVACANVAHLLLARAAAREKEVAVRAALGASRRRLVRQFLTESLLLSAAGGAVGVLLASGSVAAVRRLAGPAIPRIDAVVLDWRVLIFAVVVSMATGVVFGLAPMLKLSRPDLATALGDSDRGSSAGRRTRRLRGTLMVSEIALTGMLLVAAGLMLRSYVSMRSADPGWDPERVMSMVVSVSGTAESPPGRRTAFYTAVLDSVRALPGVERASAINHLPLSGDLWTLPVAVEGAPTPEPGKEPSAVYRVVFPDYFDTLGLELTHGRGFTDGDRLDSLPVAVVNAHFASTHWPGQDPIGQRIDVFNSGWLTVVGVAENTFLHDWGSPPAAEAYVPYLQTARYQEEPAAHTAYMTLVVRSAGDPALLQPEVRGVIRSIASDVAVSDFIEMRQVTEQATSGERFLFALLGGFAGVALLLAAVGIYGVISYDVSSRAREIGIRLALGAAPGQVLGQVVGRAMTLVALGVAASLTGAYGLSGFLAGALNGVPPTDPLVFALVPVALVGVGFCACLVPGWRASRGRPTMNG